MADAVHNVKQEYWRPSNARRLVVDPIPTDATCDCGAEYLMGARYCHICGADRVPAMGLGGFTFNWVEWLDFSSIRRRTGLGTASLIFFVVGLACAFAAVAVGWLYTANTIQEWQAVQLWRIQWLLGATVAFLAGIVLKKAAPEQD